MLWAVRKSLRSYNVLLLALSYVFYAWWDYRFLGLILFSSLIDYLVGWYLPQSNRKKLLVGISLTLNLGLLAFFKYFNFFVGSARDFLSQLGVEANEWTLQIILPVGISFYTFQTLSYTIDVYKGKLKPEKDFIIFLNYVSFFPQLVAGPIERAPAFLPQFRVPKQFNYTQAVEGMRLLLYGLFKKIVIADNIGVAVDQVYSHVGDYNGATIYAASALFYIQLYCDFSAYTDIARGVAKLLNFELMENFKTPFYCKSVPEFWSRWHLSLTTWFRDYLYIGMASMFRSSKFWRIFSTVFLFVVIGLWHGANYTYVLFGLVHGLSFIPRLLATNYKWLRQGLAFINTDKRVTFFTWLINFLYLVLTCILFRSQDMATVKTAYGKIFNQFEFTVDPVLFSAFLPALVLVVYEWFTKEKEHPFYVVHLKPIWRRSVYVALILVTLFYGYYDKDPFYYFQF